MRDPRGEGVTERARRFLHLPVRACRTRDAYKVDADLPAAQQRAVRDAFADPVVARAALGRLAPPRFDWLVEAGFKPGVTDNVGRTAATVVRDVLDLPPGAVGGVYTSVQYFLSGAGLTRADAAHLGRDLLGNELIQTLRVVAPAEWRGTPVDLELPVVRDASAPRAEPVDLSGPDAELERISREGILSLSLEEMHAIRDHFARPDVRARRAAARPARRTRPTWSWSASRRPGPSTASTRSSPPASATWTRRAGSERIDSLFKTFIRGATERIARGTDWLVSVFTDNAGIVRFNDRYHVAYKVETHNSPSALDPYGGAITGIVGVNRDPMGTGMGCELLYNVWGYCLGSPFHEGDLPEGLMHPRRIRDGVHQGVIDGGNQSGIPWARGFERFDDRYLGKPLVYCGTVGRIPLPRGRAPLRARRRSSPATRSSWSAAASGRTASTAPPSPRRSCARNPRRRPCRSATPSRSARCTSSWSRRATWGCTARITDNGAGGLSSSGRRDEPAERRRRPRPGHAPR